MPVVVPGEYVSMVELEDPELSVDPILPVQIFPNPPMQSFPGRPSPSIPPPAPPVHMLPFPPMHPVPPWPPLTSGLPGFEDGVVEF